MASRRFLSLQEKVEIIHYQSRNKVSVRVLAKRFSVGKTQIAEILKNKNQLLRLFRENVTPDNTNRFFQHGQGAILDKEVLEWFKLVRSLKIPVTGPLVQEKAMEVANKLNMKDFKASNGWLNRFRIRHKIEFKARNGSLSNKKEKDTEWTSKIGKIVQGFAMGDIFNAVKTVLFYRAIPEKKLCSDGRNCALESVARKYLTLFVCASMTGEKLNPLVVWEGTNPQCLKGVTNQSLGVSWKCVSKLWMTTDIVTDWLRELDQEMKSQNRKILFFIDNSTTHPHINLENIQLVFFPSNLTSTWQPLNQGVIQIFKVKYRQLLLNHLIANLDHNTLAQELSKSIDILSAIGWIKNALRAVLPETIQTSFTAAGFPNDSNKDIKNPKSLEEEIVHLSRMIKLLKMDMDAYEYLQIDDILAARNHIRESQNSEANEDTLVIEVKREVDSRVETYAEHLHALKKLKDFYEKEKDLEGSNLIAEVLIHHEKLIVSSKLR